jgi:dimethylhistidine N-methyltransferase
VNRPAHAIRLLDRRVQLQDMRADVLRGLRRAPKKLPSKYFYDAVGSSLFERICEQPEYYVTRVELGIMRVHVAAIASALGRRVRLVEYGSGSGIKTRLLLRELDDPVAYVPIEISHEALLGSVGALAAEFPSVEMLPVCADFTKPVALPRPQRASYRDVVYFPGSTLGNFDSREAAALLRVMRDEAGPHGSALIGIDLKKDPAVIDAAYNDAAGVTAEFTLNMLARFNRELGADFDVASYRHRARYNPMAGRIETHIVSRIAQDVGIGGERFHFDRDEAMLVEYSCKYSPDEFEALARRAGLRVARMWTDAHEQFAVVHLVPV